MQHWVYHKGFLPGPSHSTGPQVPQAARAPAEVVHLQHRDGTGQEAGLGAGVGRTGPAELTRKGHIRAKEPPWAQWVRGTPRLSPGRKRRMSVRHAASPPGARPQPRGAHGHSGGACGAAGPAHGALPGVTIEHPTPRTRVLPSNAPNPAVVQWGQLLVLGDMSARRTG